MNDQELLTYIKYRLGRAEKTLAIPGTPYLMHSSKAVTPAKAGVQCFCNHLKSLVTGFRRYDVGGGFMTFDETILLYY